jgi:hypothetical protein
MIEQPQKFKAHFPNSVETIVHKSWLRTTFVIHTIGLRNTNSIFPMTIFNIYVDQLGDQQFGAIAQAIGSTRDQAVLASSQIVPFLVSAMARNTRTDAGAKALSDMLDKDHNGSILMNLPALYANRTSTNGDALANGILGAHRAEVEAWVSQECGISAQDKINAALLAQMLNNFAEQHEREENPEAAAQEQAAAGGGGFLDKLGLGSVGGMLQSGNFAGIGKMITGMLDKNKDGSVMDDIQGMVGGIVGGNNPFGAK